RSALVRSNCESARVTTPWARSYMRNSEFVSIPRMVRSPVVRRSNAMSCVLQWCRLDAVAGPRPERAHGRRDHGRHHCAMEEAGNELPLRTLDVRQIRRTFSGEEEGIRNGATPTLYRP